MAWGKTEEEIVEQLMRQASMDQPTAKAFVEKISDLMAKEEAVRSFLQEGHKLEEAPRFLMADHGMDEASAKALVEELVMMDSLGKQPT